MVMAQENVLKRIPPNNMEAEQAIVGALLINGKDVEKADEYVKPEDFYQTHLRVIYETILNLHAEGRTVDPVLLRDKLKETSLAPEFYSNEYLNQLLFSASGQSLTEYARLVAEKALLRRLIQVSEETVKEAYAQDAGIDEIIDTAEKRVFDVTQRRRVEDEIPIKDSVMQVLDRIQKAAKTKGHITGVATGFTDLDNKLMGLQPSDLILIAARPSMGKTALALNIAEHIAFHENNAVAIFSLEMSREQLLNRLLSMESHVDSQKLRSGELNVRDWEALLESANVVGTSQMVIDDTPGISVSELRSKCRRYKSEKDIKAVFIDYLQLMTGSAGKRSDNRQQEISEISRSLKALARELNVPVIALSQLSRAVESRPNKRPMLSDLRESGAIEQDADVVMFIYRDDYYNSDTEQRNVSEINIAKQRNGPIGKVELAWRPELTKFANLAR